MWLIFDNKFKFLIKHYYLKCFDELIKIYLMIISFTTHFTFWLDFFSFNFSYTLQQLLRKEKMTLLKYLLNEIIDLSKGLNITLDKVYYHKNGESYKLYFISETN